jgi:hypothetical protein
MRLGGIVAGLVASLAWAPSGAARAEPLQARGQTIARNRGEPEERAD